MQIQDEEITWLYRMILGREATEDEIMQWRSVPSLDVLRHAAFQSVEFRGELQRFELDAPERPVSRLPLDLPPCTVEWEVSPDIMTRLLDHVTGTWTALGHDKPHWSVLSSEQFLPEKIEENRRNFYASGAADAKRIVAALGRHGRSPVSHPRIVEYGCGVGRVTPHLAQVFREVTAIDISTSHIAMAEATTLEAGAWNARFQLARAPEFGMHAPFDLWFSYIVLQHNPPPVIAMVLRRAFMMLAPGGIAMFQVPTYAMGYHFNTTQYLASPTSTGTIEVHCLPQQVVYQLAAEAGCLPLETREDDGMGPPSHWLSNTFIFAKPA
jgi:2-polyprenyl-3-methyl-5-hydroxy-6-metoxy-1,4-benzoquinol methylase